MGPRRGSTHGHKKKDDIYSAKVRTKSPIVSSYPPDSSLHDFTIDNSMISIASLRSEGSPRDVPPPGQATE